MVYKPFAFSLAIRTGLLLVNLVILSFLFARSDLFFNQLILGLLLIFQVYELSRCISWTNRELARLVSALQYGEFSVQFNQHRADPSFGQLYAAFDRALTAYRRAGAEKQARLQYLELIFTHLEAGVLILSEQSTVVFMNTAAGDLLQIPPGIDWQQIKVAQPNLAEKIDGLKEGGRTLVEWQSHQGQLLLSVQVSLMTVLGRPHRLITLQDIKPEIEQKETEAWYKLIRVLTHEIMNSVTPICSMTETATAMLEEARGIQTKSGELSAEALSDLRFSLKTISRRSEGMLHFVENYQKLSRIPQPQLMTVSVPDLLTSVGQLMQAEALKRGVSLEMNAQIPDCLIQADTKLIEQVLINLIRNSLDALANTQAPMLRLGAAIEGAHTVLDVTDNGTGIDPDKLDKIFMPFYSTKADGSGIGLSLGRQIMRLHRGFLQVSSEPGTKTSFYLKFPSC